MFRTIVTRLGLIIVLGVCGAASAEENTGMTAGSKTKSAFYTSELVERARSNAGQHDWAAAMRQELVEKAGPWLAMSDEDLWSLMFGPTITRSWMVWSDGYCPACKNDVRMYAWKIDPFEQPWKVRCPHCAELFPKNDFAAFYRSGLDDRGIFRPDRADRSLLFNADHPDPNDPLHGFGVDDGEGYLAEGHRWRFIGCYLIYGQWKRAILGGIVNLGAAYVVTGDPQYAVKAAILLDRAADIFPTFDFSRQGEVYEDPKLARGQISQWHDACGEMLQLVLAYDRIFEGARAREPELTEFLSKKAGQFRIENPKRTWADIQRNIEENLFLETLAHRDRIESNYPTTDITILCIKTVLGWPGNREEVLGLLDEILKTATAVDGVSGEKGLDGYGRIAPNTVAVLLGRFSQLEPELLKTVYARCPAIHAMYRFHLDTWCMDEWYPRVGDTGTFGMKNPTYAGVPFTKNPGVEPSMASFLWNLYEITDDPAFAQLLYRINGSTVEGLPYDLFWEDPAALQQRVQEVVDRHGSEILRESLNKEAWHLAILRSGQGDHRRALWLDYDSGERHGHADALNLGLFAKGLDLMPDLGYPPVGYGGWGAPKAVWYKMAASHNTVVVDGQDQTRGDGNTTLWAVGDRFRAVRAACPAAVPGCEQFERTAVLIDMDEEDFYVVDAFFVVGGRDHAKFFHSFFGEVKTEGLALSSGEPYGYGTEMRNFRTDPAPSPPWSVEWRIEDRYDYLPEGREVRLRYTGLTPKCSVSLAEGWVETTLYGQGQEAWIPRLLIRRRSGESPLRSAFVAVIEPYERARRLTSIRRLPLESVSGRPLPDDFIGIELARTDGRTDVGLLVDGRGPAEVLEPVHDIDCRGEVAWATFGSDGLERLALCRVERIRIDRLHVVGKAVIDFAELRFDADGVHVAAGPLDPELTVMIDGVALPVHDDRL